MKKLLSTGCLWLIVLSAFAQKHLPLIQSGVNSATIVDGKYVSINWQLDPVANPDIYYVNVPRSNSKVVFRTDKGSLTFKTRFGKDYNFLVVINGKDTCHLRISATNEPAVRQAQSNTNHPDTIPFALKGARVYLQGILNGIYPVAIQFDLGAGGTVVNKMASGKLSLNFTTKTTITNTQGTQDARTSQGNSLTMGNFKWNDLPFTEVGNMTAEEDIIIGNGLFRDKVIELDYDRKLMIVSDKLTARAKEYQVQPVIYEQNRPKFQATIYQNNQSFSFWFLFDTGRDGAMVIGRDFTSMADNWNKLQPLTTLPDGRKIIRLDALIGGQRIKDIVTNAVAPGSAESRPTLFGNQVLNHFNMILDNRTGLLYLKPNSRVNEHYANYDDYLKIIKK